MTLRPQRHHVQISKKGDNPCFSWMQTNDKLGQLSYFIDASICKWRTFANVMYLKKKLYVMQWFE